MKAESFFFFFFFFFSREKNAKKIFFFLYRFHQSNFVINFSMPRRKYKSMSLESMILMLLTFGFVTAKPRIFDGIPVTSDSPLLKSHVSIMEKLKEIPFCYPAEEQH